MREAAYLKNLRIIEKNQYHCYIISGSEEYQKQGIIAAIKNKYKEQKFQIHCVNECIKNKEITGLRDNTKELFEKAELIQVHFNNNLGINEKNLIDFCCKHSNEDKKYLFVFHESSVTRKQMQWLKSIDYQGFYFHSKQTKEEESIDLIQHELKDTKFGANISQNGLKLLVERTGNNLVTIKNIIEIIRYQKEKNFDKNLVDTYLNNLIQHTIFDLTKSIVKQDLNETINILEYMMKTKKEPTLILWSFLKEIRLLLQLTNKTYNEQKKIYLINKIWDETTKIQYRKIAKNIENKNYRELLGQCFYIDLIIKGVYTGNIKREFTKLVFQLYRFIQK